MFGSKDKILDLVSRAAGGRLRKQDAALRTVAWRMLLGLLPFDADSDDGGVSSWAAAIREKRAEYTELLAEYKLDPSKVGAVACSCVHVCVCGQVLTPQPTPALVCRRWMIQTHCCATRYHWTSPRHGSSSMQYVARRVYSGVGRTRCAHLLMCRPLLWLHRTKRCCTPLNLM